MSNASNKGNRNVNKVRSLFYQMEYLIDTCEKKGRYLKQKDLFGAFDLVALHLIEKPCFIQVSSNVPHTHKKYLEFAKTVSKHQIICQLTWYDRAGFIGYIYHHNNNTKTIVDGRKISMAEFTEKFRVALSNPLN